MEVSRLPPREAGVGWGGPRQAGPPRLRGAYEAPRPDPQASGGPPGLARRPAPGRARALRRLPCRFRRSRHNPHQPGRGRGPPRPPPGGGSVPAPVPNGPGAGVGRAGGAAGCSARGRCVSDLPLSSSSSCFSSSPLSPPRQGPPRGKPYPGPLPSAGLQRSPGGPGSGSAAWLGARRDTQAATAGASAGLRPVSSSCGGLALSPASMSWGTPPPTPPSPRNGASSRWAAAPGTALGRWAGAPGLAAGRRAHLAPVLPPFSGGDRQQPGRPSGTGTLHRVPGTASLSQELPAYPPVPLHLKTTTDAKVQLAIGPVPGGPRSALGRARCAAVMVKPAQVTTVVANGAAPKAMPLQMNKPHQYQMGTLRDLIAFYGKLHSKEVPACKVV